MTLHIDRYNDTDPKPDMLSAVYAKNRIWRNEKNVHSIGHAHMIRKEDFFKQRQLNHKGMGDGDYGTRRHIAEPYSCLLVWVTLHKNISQESQNVSTIICNN